MLCAYMLLAECRSESSVTSWLLNVTPLSPLSLARSLAPSIPSPRPSTSRALPGCAGKEDVFDIREAYRCTVRGTASTTLVLVCTTLVLP